MPEPGMTRAEAVEELATRYRLRLGCMLRHGAHGAVLDGSTLGTDPADLRAAVHGLVDKMLDRLLELVAREDA
jgi:hypothetical protein